MKPKAGEIDRIVRNPGELAAALVYGPDSGLARERGAQLARAIVADLSDPFLVCGLSESDLKNDPARLFDEAAALSMMGGRRLIRLRINGDSQSKVIGEFVSDLDAGNKALEGFLLVEAGDLGPRSSVRKLFEASKSAAALPCYPDDAGTVEKLIEDTLRGHGWQAPMETMGFLVSHLGSDRQLTRQELEKLVLYLGKGEGRSPVSLADAQAAIGDASALTVDGLLDAVGAGDVDRVDTELTKCFDGGQTPVGLLRAATGHFSRLARVAALVGTGVPAGQAIGKLRPPIHFKRRQSFERQVSLWRPKLLAQALDLLLASEARCKTTGAPDVMICGDALVRLAVRARSLRGRA